MFNVSYKIGLVRMGGELLQLALDDKNFQDGNTRISFRYLKKMNLIAGCLHLIQFVFMLGMAIAVENISGFSLPLELRFLTFDVNSSRLVGGQDGIGKVYPGLLVPFFLLLSSLFHFLVISPIGWEKYIVGIDAGINRFRWYEYAISSSLMIWVISMFFGVYDLASLILIAGVNASMNFFGKYSSIGAHFSKASFLFAYFRIHNGGNQSIHRYCTMGIFHFWVHRRYSSLGSYRYVFHW